MITFIIPTCIQKEIHLNMLIKCIESIRCFHKESFIYLINDSDENYNKEFLTNILHFNNNRSTRRHYFTMLFFILMNHIMTFFTNRY